MSSKTYVDSVVYSMAGDEDEIPNFLRSTIFGGIVTGNSDSSVAEHLVGSMLSGPGMRVRNFHRWARAAHARGEWAPGVLKDFYKSSNQAMFEWYEKTEELKRLISNPNAFLSLYRILGVSEDGAPGWVEAQTWQAFRNQYNITEFWFHKFRCWWNPTTRIATWSSPTMGIPPTDYPLTSTDLDDTQWIMYVYYPQSIVGDNPPTERYYYRVGSGSEIFDQDSLGFPQQNEFLPIIPLRINNEAVNSNSTSYAAVYDQIKKGYKKAFGGNIDDLLEQIEDNPDIGDIDFAFITFAVPLNTKRKEAQRYIFDFFEDVHNRLGNETNFSLSIGTDPFSMPGHIWGTWAVTDLRMSIFIQSVSATTTSGTLFAGARVGDVTISASGTTGTFRKQVGPNQIKTVTATGLQHVNTVYGGESINIEAGDAIVDTELSGFLVPISYEVFSGMSLVKSNQLALECTHIVFNCYKVVKKKWYQKGIFKALLVIAVIVITFVTGGFGATSAGLLGTNIAVGTAIGFTGLAAVIAGAVANMVAAMIVTKLVTMVTVELLGEELGAIIAAVAAFVTLQVGVALRNGGSFASSFTNIFDPKNLLKMGLAVGDGVASSINAATMDMIAQTQQMYEEFSKQSEKIQQLMKQLNGSSDLYFDVMELTDVNQGFVESLDSFLDRTLMTGMDIAKLTNESIGSFSKVTINTDLA